MHINLSLSATSRDGVIEIPLQYNHLIQGVIYNSIEVDLAAFLHDKGYQSGKRNFKLFTFSRLMGDFRINREKNKIRFTNELQLVISSPIDQFCQSIANGMLTRGEIVVNHNTVRVNNIIIKQYNVDKLYIKVKTLSPVVVYSTLFRPDGRKYTCYFQPGDPDYNRIIENNLRKKYHAFYGKEAPEGKVDVKKIGSLKLNILNYKNTIIKGYSGKLMLTAPKELLQMAIDAGIGSKNSQGFGCIEAINNGRR